MIWINLIIGLLSLIVGYVFGYRQGKIAQAALDLSITKAIPKIGTAIKIDKRQENPSAFPPFYYLVVTIHNEGELPAHQLKGNCRLYSLTKGVKERNIPIERELLGASPYELESVRLEDGISGMTLNIGGPGEKISGSILILNLITSGLRKTAHNTTAQNTLTKIAK